VIDKILKYIQKNTYGAEADTLAEYIKEKCSDIYYFLTTKMFMVRYFK